MSQLKIFSGRASRGLAEKIAEEIGEPLGQCEIVCEHLPNLSLLCLKL